MQAAIRILLIAALTLLTQGAVAEVGPTLERARQAAKHLGASLKGELQVALQQGGPLAAIDVCKLQAPIVAQQVSGQVGGRVGRTALKLRNPENAPDVWEREVLEAFEIQRRAGEAVFGMEQFRVFTDSSGSQLRYMKAIPTAALCLACHGENLSAEIERHLSESYPEDSARGFALGDIRGAFTVTLPMP